MLSTKIIQDSPLIPNGTCCHGPRPGPEVTFRSALSHCRSEQSGFVKAEDWKENVWNIEEVEATA